MQTRIFQFDLSIADLRIRYKLNELKFTVNVRIQSCTELTLFKNGHPLPIPIYWGKNLKLDRISFKLIRKGCINLVTLAKSISVLALSCNRRCSNFTLRRLKGNKMRIYYCQLQQILLQVQLAPLASPQAIIRYNRLAFGK